MRAPTSSAAAAAAVVGGDNREAVLQRLVSDMQLLQSKLDMFNTSSMNQNVGPVSGHGTSTMLPSDDVEAKINELKQRHDAEVALSIVVCNWLSLSEETS